MECLRRAYCRVSTGLFLPSPLRPALPRPLTWQAHERGTADSVGELSCVCGTDEGAHGHAHQVNVSEPQGIHKLQNNTLVTTFSNQTLWIWEFCYLGTVMIVLIDIVSPLGKYITSGRRCLQEL